MLTTRAVWVGAPPAPLTRALYRYLMEPGSLIMERKMLLGIKQRAERLARDAPPPAGADGGPGR
jgi:hypothetical protein